MAHQLDFTTGQAAIAFRGETPWHGLGQTIQPEDTITDIQLKAGLAYSVDRSPVQFADRYLGTHIMPNRHVLFRSDNSAPLSVVSDRYQVVQPQEVMEFYHNLVNDMGFAIEVAGALQGGKKVWALASTGHQFKLRGDDEVKGYLLLATSYDGTMATQARFTSVRVVCNNTLTIASRGKADVTVSHATKFDASRVQSQLGIQQWSAYKDLAEEAQVAKVSIDTTSNFLVQAYFNLRNKDELREFNLDKDNDAKVKRMLQRVAGSIANAPGARMESAHGTLWGALQAVTHDVDHNLPSRDRGSRLNKAWFGEGEAIKQRARALTESYLMGRGLEVAA